MASEPLPRGRFAGFLVAIALLFAVVVASSRAHLFGDGGPAVGLAVRRTLTDTVFYLLVLYLIAIAALVVWALWPDERLATGKLERPGLLKTMVVPLVFTLLLGLALALRVRPNGGGNPFSGFGQGLLPPALAQGGGASVAGAPPGLDWTALTLVALLAGGAGASLWYRRRRRRRATLPRPALAERLEEAVADGLEELRDQPDPRLAVIAAYSRMELVLGRGGFGRRPSEAPYEYLARLLGVAGLAPEPATRLTGLFELARFSQHALEAADRSAAIEALEAIRAELAGRDRLE